MVSENVYMYLCDFVNSNSKEYPYYVVVTNYYNYSNNNDYDIYVYFSKNAHRNNVYSYGGNFVVYGLRTSNANNYYYSARVQYLGTSADFSTSNYEHSFTNIDYKTYVEVPCLNTNYNNQLISNFSQSVFFGIFSIAVITYFLIKR